MRVYIQGSSTIVVHIFFNQILSHSYLLQLTYLTKQCKKLVKKQPLSFFHDRKSKEILSRLGRFTIRFKKSGPS